MPRMNSIKHAFAALTFSLLSTVAMAASAPPTWTGLSLSPVDGIPPASVLKTFLAPGQTVRCPINWGVVEPSIGHYLMPGYNTYDKNGNLVGDKWPLYTGVAAAGGKNIVTLFGGNSLYGLGDFAFATTPQQIQAFANFAAWIVANDGTGTPNAKAANIPNLYAVSIWNEMNGGWTGGINTVKGREDAMAALLTVAVPAMRQSNPKVKIIAGATVGIFVAGWFQHINEHFDLSTVDYLDIHPYLAEGPYEIGPKGTPVPTYVNLQNWREDMKLLRNGTVDGQGHVLIPPIKNPAFYTEWGGPSMVRYSCTQLVDETIDHKTKKVCSQYNFSKMPDFFDWFANNVVAADPVPVAGGDYFTISNALQFPDQGLTQGPSSRPPYDFTPTGILFLGKYVSPYQH